MTPFRWTLLALVALAGVASLLLIPHVSNEAPPASPASAQARALRSAPPSAVAPQAAGPTPSVAPVPAAAMVAPLRVGSEGYGPHIDRAQAGNDAQAAWEAVGWLRLCASTEARRDSYERARNLGVVPEAMTEMMREADAEARRCQTVTTQHQALLPELASRAMRAGVPDAASAYANAVFPGDLTPEQRRAVADAMRRDARSGSMGLLEVARSNEAWGLSDEERLAFLYAYGELFSDLAAKAHVKALMQQGSIPFRSPPTPERLAEAQVAGQQIVDRARVGR